jgi:hypothetical protein
LLKIEKIKKNSRVYEHCHIKTRIKDEYLELFAGQFVFFNGVLICQLDFLYIDVLKVDVDLLLCICFLKIPPPLLGYR